MSISPFPIRCSSDKCTEYNPDIDGQTDLLPDIQPSMASHTTCTEEASSHAKNIEENTVPVTTNSGEHSTFLQDSNKFESQSQPVLDSTEYSVHQDTEQSREEYPNNYRPQLEDIPELEDDEENWEEGQFAYADFIDHHKTTEESDRICCKYSGHFEKVTDQGYRSQNNQMPGLEYYIHKLEYYNSDTHQNNIKGIKIQTYTSLPHHLQKIYGNGMDKAMVE